MSKQNGHAYAGAAYAPATGEYSYKSASPAGLERRRQTPAGAGDLTPTQSRTTSPFRVNPSSLKTALSGSSSTTTCNDADPSSTSVDRSDSDSVVHLLHANSPPDRGHSSQGTSNIYDSLLSKSSNSPLPSRSLTPKLRPPASAADGIPDDDKDMSNTSPRPGPSSGPSRSTPARRQQQQQQQQQQQRGLQPYGYYPSPSVSESRNPPSISGQGAPPSFAHTQQPATPQRPTGYVGQYTMSPPPASLYPQHPSQYVYPPQLNIPSIPPLAHSHSTSDFFPVGHSVSPTQPHLYAQSFHASAPLEHASTPALAYDYDRGGSARRSPATGAGSPYTPQQPFASFNYHSTLAATPQFAHSHSPFSTPFQAHQTQHAQQPQYPPSFAYLTGATPTPEDAAQLPSATWWYMPSHSALPTTGPYPSMYYLDAYGNSSNPGLGFQSLSSPSSSQALQPPSFSLSEAVVSSGTGAGSGGPQRPVEEHNKPESRPSSSRGPLSPALGESVSERGQQQQQAQTQSKQSNRRSFLPNPPAQRSEWVMWVGNVPSDATHDELWRFFARPLTPNTTSPVEARAPYRQQLHQPPHLPAGLLSQSSSSSASDTAPAGATGIASVFLIARSNCAFVNYASAAHLAAAVQRFNGIPLRSGDPRCPRLVCRVRGKDEDMKAGVGGQRGTGIHTRWIREQREREKTRDLEEKRGGQKERPMEDGEASASEPPGTPSSVVQTESGAESARDTHSGRPLPHHSSSSGSTTSGFLARYFPKRFFILKSLTQYDLDLSVEKGVWATQPHNETILNQAFRNSSDVYLIFGVNKSGEFFGYARMASPIGKSADDHVSWASRTDSQHSLSPAMSFVSSVAGKGSQVSETIPEENEDKSPEAKEDDDTKGRKHEREKEKHPFILFSPGEHRLAEDSPQPVTPHTQKRLSNAEASDSGKISLSSEANTAPPSDRHHDKLKGSIPQGRDGHPSLHPGLPPTSAPAVMGPPYRRITNPPVEGLSSETMDPRILRRRLPSIELDPEAPMRAVREQEARGASDEQPIEDADRVKRKDTFNKSSGSSGSKLREMVQPEPLRSPMSPEPESGPEDTGSSTQARAQVQGQMQTETGRDDLPAQWGPPFKVQWLRVGKLPFHRTRHLRNPWNHEREVKVSRDGTELEPSIGQALLDEWDKEEPPPAPSTPTSGTGSGAGPMLSVMGKRASQFRRTQSQVQTPLVAENEAGPAPGSPRAHQQKQRPR